MRRKEQKAVDTLLTAATDPHFSPVTFGEAIKNLAPGHQVAVWAAITATIDALYSDYVLGHYDSRNQQMMYDIARMKEHLSLFPNH